MHQGQHPAASNSDINRFKPKEKISYVIYQKLTLEPNKLQIKTHAIETVEIHWMLWVVRGAE